VRLRTGPPPTVSESSGRPEKVLGIVGGTPSIILRDGPLAAGPQLMDVLDRFEAFHLPYLSTLPTSNMKKVRNALIDEVASIEKVEADLDRFIERRAQGAKSGKEWANAEEALLRASDRRRAEVKRQENAREWAAHYRALSYVHHDLAAANAAKADALAEGEGGTAA
jgi:hypothetical protein